MRALTLCGYEVTAERVETRETLTAALDRQAWDLVIADYTMPRFSGLAALDLLRERDPDLPFIFVSGTIGEDAAVAVRDAMRTRAVSVPSGSACRVTDTATRACSGGELWVRYQIR